MKRISLLCLFFQCLYMSLAAYESDCQQDLGRYGIPKFRFCGVTLSAFDIDSETIWLWRTTSNRKINFSSNGVDGQKVLKSSDLDYGSEFGYRLALQLFFDNYDYCELSYMNVGQWSETKKRQSPNDNLYSVFSGFGVDPAGGYPDTDQAYYHKIKSKSEFYTWEAMYWRYFRCYEVPNVCYINSYLIGGYRYLNLDETFKFRTRTNNGSMDYKTDALNQLHGLEIGYAVNAPMSCQWELGFEAKAAFYSNHAEQKTTIIAGSLTHPVQEKKDDTFGTWGLDGRLKASYEVIPNWYLRGGYQLLYINSVAQAVDNFNSASFFDEPRKAKLKTECIAWQGLYFGVEVCW